MSQKSKNGFFSVFTIILLSVAGFIFLLRGCLSKHDEYSQLGEAQQFHSSKGDVIVYLKEYYRVTSYSSQGGFTQTSGYRRYYIETRNAGNLNLIISTKFDKVDEPYTKQPVFIGCNKKLIWIFHGGIKAFDPLTHEIVCDEAKLSQLNPFLNNNFPVESKYYDYSDNSLQITTKDANEYTITDLFKAKKIGEKENVDPEGVAELKHILENLETKRSKGGFSHGFMIVRDSIRLIRQMINDKTDEYRNIIEYKAKIEEINKRGFNYADEMLENAVVSDSFIYSLLSIKQLKENENSFFFSTTYSKDVQRFLCKTLFNELKKSRGFFNRAKIIEWKLVNKDIQFLNGAFLKNKETLEPICLSNPKSWLIFSSREVGNKSPKILQRVNEQGVLLWAKELPIFDFCDIKLTSENLVFFAEDDDLIAKGTNTGYIISINLKSGDYVMSDIKKKNPAVLNEVSFKF